MKYRHFIALVVWTVFVFFLGAHAHEGDLQRSCKESGSTKGAGWRGEMICLPVEVKAN